MPETNPWSDGDRAILNALSDGRLRTAGEINVDMPPAVVQALLAQNLRAGYLDTMRGTVRTTYQITVKGLQYLKSLPAGV